MILKKVFIHFQGGVLKSPWIKGGKREGENVYKTFTYLNDENVLYINSYKSIIIQ